jgi:hypothetical protein
MVGGAALVGAGVADAQTPLDRPQLPSSIASATDFRKRAFWSQGE